MRVIISAILFITCQSVYGVNFEGKTKNGYFYPANQKWKVVAIKKVSKEKLPPGSGAVTYFLMNSNVYITDRYLTIKNLNSSGSTIIDACFKMKGNNLQVSSYGRSRRVIGESFEFVNQGKHIIMPMGKHILLKLEKQPLGKDFKTIKAKFDSAFNYYTSATTMLNAPCGLKKINTPKLANQDLKITADNGKDVTLKNHSLDSSTFIKYSSISYARKVPVTNNQVIDGCQAKEQQYRFTTERKKRGTFYLVGNINGIDTTTQKRCTKVTSLKMFSTSKILDLYSINYKDMNGIILPPITSLSFVKWKSDNSVIASVFNQATSSRLNFEISDFHTNQIKVKKLLSE